MRWIALCLFLCCLAQSAATAQADNSASQKDAKAGGLVIPAGTKVPLTLKQAISTKTAKEGDAVYAMTAFPIAIDDRILIPGGTYVQGKISHIQRGGHAVSDIRRLAGAHTPACSG